MAGKFDDLLNHIMEREDNLPMQVLVSVFDYMKRNTKIYDMPNIDEELLMAFHSVGSRSAREAKDVKGSKTSATSGGGSASKSSDDHYEVYDIVIVGGGVSGLSAARQLCKARESVKGVILEGRDRLGGRVWTDENGYDLGASWIHGHVKNPIYEIGKKINCAMKVTDYDNAQRYTSRGEMSDRDDKTMDQVWERMEDIIEKRGNMLRGKGDISTSVADVISETASSIGAKSSQALHQLHFSAVCEIEHEFGADISELSAAGFDEGEEVKGKDFMFTKGYRQIVEYVREGVKFPILQNHTVSKIAYNDDGVGAVVTTTNGKVFHCKAVIVTVPLGVLKASVDTSPPPCVSDGAIITFDPPLPPSLTHSIQSLGVGTLNKYILTFDSTCRLPPEYDVYHYMDDESQAKRWPEIYNVGRVTGKDLKALMAFSAGKISKELGQLPDDTLKKNLVNQVRKMFPSLPDPVHFLSTRWDVDPFALGSYSFIATGSKADDRRQFEKPLYSAGKIPRVFFAGEHTSLASAATVHGAYNSGIAAADKVLSVL